MISLAQVRQDIQKHFNSHGSAVSKPLVIAVSKLQSVEKIRELYSHGQRAFAENYVQEAALKQGQLQDLDIEWHLIGHLQKNKVKQVLGKFTLIHSVDSLELAQLLDQKCSDAGLTQKVLLQVNVAGEFSKQGFSAEELLASWPALKQLSSLKIQGLMTMPPLDLLGESVRPHFRRLRELRDQLGLIELSMGTSHDFKVALEEGSTIIRLGTILFGERS